MAGKKKAAAVAPVTPEPEGGLAPGAFAPPVPEPLIDTKRRPKLDRKEFIFGAVYENRSPLHVIRSMCVGIERSGNDTYALFVGRGVIEVVIEGSPAAADWVQVAGPPVFSPVVAPAPRVSGDERPGTLGVLDRLRR